jgi:hypothetical protein
MKQGGGKVATASESSKINLDFLINELGLKQERNTKVFRKGEIFVVSPSVQNKYNWFDVGESIMDLFNDEVHEGYLIVRFKEQFLMSKLKSFQKKMMSIDTQPNTTKLPPHWKFKVMEAANPYILNMGDGDLIFPMQAPSRNQLVKYFNK